MQTDLTLTLPDGRTVGFADYGPASGRAVLWCHGGPGSRLEPRALAEPAAEAGFRLIGIDRPGYGLSTARPGRDIASWVPDALAVLDHLGIDQCHAVGVSTGGAYALALAATHPERVRAVVACCALTDMRWDEGKAMLPVAGTRDIWGAPDREAGMAFAVDLFGADGGKMGQPPEDSPGLTPADFAFLGDPQWLPHWAAGQAQQFAQGVAGYTDDRIADGPGWGTFDVAAVRCPVTVLHGANDTIVPVAHAHHTAAIVPNATLRIVEGEGHLSILRHLLPALVALRHED
jgi:pimeloyl-ACP methyl ester carboxylesterase